jgi:hypothetical protein
MTRLTNLGRGVQIMLVASALLLATTFLDWQRLEFSLGRLGSGRVEVNAWDDFLGAMMGLLTIALLVWIIVRVTGFKVPAVVSKATVDVLLAALIFGFALIKNITNDYSTWASYAGVALALVILGGALLEFRGRGEEELQPEAGNAADTERASGVSDAASPASGSAADTTSEASDDVSHHPSRLPPDAGR